jgi:hypothetical protein
MHVRIYKDFYTHTKAFRTGFVPFDLGYHMCETYELGDGTHDIRANDTAPRVSLTTIQGIDCGVEGQKADEAHMEIKLASQNKDSIGHGESQEERCELVHLPHHALGSREGVRVCRV